MVGNKYNNINDSSSSSIASIQTQQVLTRLSIAIENLEKTSKELNLNKSLDPQLQKISAQYEGNPLAIQSVYSNIRNEMYDSEIAPLQASIQQQQQKIAELNMKLSRSYANQAVTTNQDLLPQATQENIPLFQNIANQYQSAYNPILPNLASSNAYSQYFTGSLSSLSPNTTFGVDADIGNLANANLGFAFQQGLSTRYRSMMQDSQDPEMFRSYTQYTRDMMERSQKAAINQNFSNALGVGPGLIPTAELEQGYIPAVNNMADVLNVDLDNALKIVRKMKDLRAVTADISSGRAEQIALGVDETLKVINSVSKLVGSQDLRQIMQASSTISQFGGGNFRTGLETIFQSAGDEFGSMDNAGILKQVMNPYTQQYTGQFGYSAAALKMGSFQQQMMEDVGAYGQYGNSSFRALGDVAGVTGLTSRFISQELNNPLLMVTGAGGGDLFAGANALSAEASSNPASFLMGQSARMYDLRNQYSGAAGLDMIRDRMSYFRRMFPGFSEDEIMLAASRGNANVANALQQSMAAQNAGTQDFLETLGQGLGAIQYSGGGTLDLNALRDRIMPQYQGLTSVPYRAGTFDSPLMTSMFGGIPVWGGQMAERARHSIRGVEAFGSKVMQFISSGNTAMTASEMAQAGVQGFTDSTGKIIRQRFNETEGSGQLSNSTLESNNRFSLLASAVQTDEAIAKMEEIANDPRIGGFIDSNMIKEILRAGVFGLASISGIDRAMVDSLYTYIDSANINEIHRNLKTLLPPDSTFMMMLNRAVGLGGSQFIAGMETTTRNLLMRGFISGGAGTRAAETLAMDGASWKQSNARLRSLMNQNETATSIASFGTSIIGGAIGGALAGPAGLIIGGVIGSVALEAAPEISEGARQATESLQTQFSDFVDVEEISEFFSDESYSRTQKELQVIITFLTEALARKVGTNISNEALKKQVMKILTAIMNNAALIAQNKDIENPLAGGIISKVTNNVLNTYINDFESRSYGEYAIREIFMILLNPEGTFYNDLKKNRKNKIMRTAQNLLSTTMSDLGAWFLQDITQKTFSNVLRQGFQSNLTAGTISSTLENLANAPRAIAIAKDIESVNSVITQKLSASGRSEAAITSAVETVREITAFLDPNNTEAVEPSITEEQYQLLEESLGKKTAQSLRSILDKDLSTEETRMRLGRLYEEQIYDRAKTKETEKALKSQLYGDMLIGALDYIKNSGRVNEVRDNLEDLGLA